MHENTIFNHGDEHIFHLLIGKQRVKLELEINSMFHYLNIKSMKSREEGTKRMHTRLHLQNDNLKLEMPDCQDPNQCVI